MAYPPISDQRSLSPKFAVLKRHRERTQEKRIAEVSDVAKSLLFDVVLYRTKRYQCRVLKRPRRMSLNKNQSDVGKKGRPFTITASPLFLTSPDTFTEVTEHDKYSRLHASLKENQGRAAKLIRKAEVLIYCKIVSSGFELRKRQGHGNFD